MKNKSLSKSGTTPPLLLLISAIALIVSACGGGGATTGGGGSPANLTPEQRISRFLEDAHASHGINIDTKIDTAHGADAILNPNNIIRSSGYDDQNDKSTVLSITTGENSISFGLTNDGYSVATITSDANTPTTKVPGENDFTAYYLSERRDDSGPSQRNPRIVEALVYTDRTTDNTDYTTFGYWVVSLVENFNPLATEIAPFSSGGSAPTPIAYLHPDSGSSTATYKGNAIGLVRKGSGSSINGNSFVADVELTTIFQPTTTSGGGFATHSNVRGMLTDITTDAGEDIADIDLPAARLSTILETPKVEVAGGAFSRKLAELDGTSSRWEGRFYGDEAEVVSGSFSRIALASNTTLIGSFGARKETPTE